MRCHGVKAMLDKQQKVFLECIALLAWSEAWTHDAEGPNVGFLSTLTIVHVWRPIKFVPNLYSQSVGSACCAKVGQRNLAAAVGNSLPIQEITASFRVAVDDIL